MEKPAIAVVNAYKPNTAAHRLLKQMALGSDLVCRIDALSGYVGDVWLRYMQQFVDRGLAVLTIPEGSRKNLAFRAQTIELTEDGKTLAAWLDYYETTYTTKVEVNDLRHTAKGYGTNFVESTFTLYRLKEAKATTEGSKAERQKLIDKLEERIAAFTTAEIVAEIEAAEYGRKNRQERLEQLRADGVVFADDLKRFKLAFMTAKLTYGHD